MLASILAILAKALGIGDRLMEMLQQDKLRRDGANAQRAADQAATIQAAKDVAAVAADDAGRSTDELRRRVLHDAAPDA